MSFSIDTNLMPIPGNIFVGIADTQTFGAGFDSLHLTGGPVSNIGGIVTVTFTLDLTTSADNSGYGIDYLFGDPAGSFTATPFDLTFTSSVDATNYLTSDPVFDLGPAPPLGWEASSVPEPCSLSLLVGGAITAFGLRRLRPRPWRGGVPAKGDSELRMQGSLA